MTDQHIALDGRVDDIDLTDGTRMPAFDEADPAGNAPKDDESGGRGKVAAMAAGAVTLAIGVLLGMRWARKRRADATVVIIDEPEAARWRQLLQRGAASTAA